MKINGQFVTPISPASLLALRDGPGSWAAVGSLRDVRRDDAGAFRAVFTPPHAVVPIPLQVTITVQRATADGALLHVHGRRGPHAVDVALTVDLSDEPGGTRVSWAADLAIRGPAAGVGQRVARDLASAAISDVLHQAAAAA
jgi:Carbon monoxide dehydrogenase subunit G (CoxG)